MLDTETRTRAQFIISEGEALDPLPRYDTLEGPSNPAFEVPELLPATPTIPPEVYPGFAMPMHPPGALLINPRKEAHMETAVEEDGTVTTVTYGPDLGLVAGTVPLTDPRLGNADQVVARTGEVPSAVEEVPDGDLVEGGPLRAALDEGAAPPSARAPAP